MSLSKLEYETKQHNEMQVFASGATRKNKIGKGRYDLIPPVATERAAKVLEIGAAEYGERNWEKGFPMTRTLDSALRHINNYLAGVVTDCDTGLPTLSHALVNLMFANHFEEGVTRGLYQAKEILDGVPWFDKIQRLPDELQEVGRKG